MEKRTCAGGSLTLPVLGMGCWAFGGAPADYWGAQSQAETDRLVGLALDRGCTYLDTAEMYNNGASETALGRALQGRRAEAVLGSKIVPRHCRPGQIEARCEASLKRLRTDCLDVYMVHWPLDTEPAVPGEPPLDTAAAFDALMALKRAGKIKHIGVSNFGVEQLTAARAAGAEIAVNELPYGLLARAVEWDLLGFCQAHGIGVIAYMTLMQGILTDAFTDFEALSPNRTRTRHFSSGRPGTRHGEPGFEAETRAAVAGIRAAAREWGLPVERVALAWAVGNPAVTCTLAGMRNVAQLEGNLAAADTVLTAAPRARLDALTRPLMEAWGPTVDLWLPPAKSRTR